MPVVGWLNENSHWTAWNFPCIKELIKEMAGACNSINEKTGVMFNETSSYFLPSQIIIKLIKLR